MHILEEVGLDGRADVPRWHAAKRRIGPKCRLAGTLAVFGKLVRHAFVHLHIVLFDALAFKHGVEVDPSDGGEDYDGCDDAPNFPSLSLLKGRKIPLFLCCRGVIHGLIVFCVDFFKISVFPDARVDMGILRPFGLRGGFVLRVLLHLPLQFLHLSPEYQFDNHAESIENQQGGE